MFRKSQWHEKSGDRPPVSIYITDLMGTVVHSKITHGPLFMKVSLENTLVSVLCVAMTFNVESLGSH